MSGTMREFVSALADDNSEKESDLISLDIEDDKFFLLHFIIGTYFGPYLRKHHQKQSAFQIQAANLTATFTSDELSGSLMKRAEIERVYHHILNNADPSLILKPKTLRNYFIGKSRGTKGDSPLFTDLYPSKLHPKTRVENRYNLINSIVFINDPDTSCMREECIQRFKRLTGLQSFTLRLNIDVTETNDSLAANEVLDEIDEILKEDTCLKVPITCASNYNASTGEQSGGAAKPAFGESEVIARALAGPMVGLMDIGECEDAYLFRVLLPGVKRDERYFSCEVEDNGKVLVRGVTTTGEKQVHRYSQVFEMQTQNLCPPGHFSVSFHLPGPVHPHEFSGSFGTDGILEGIVMKNLQKQIVYS